MTTSEIRAYLANGYGVDLADVKTGAEGSSEEAGLYEGETDAWIINGQMPGSIESGWFFAGYDSDIIAEVTASQEN